MLDVMFWIASVVGLMAAWGAVLYVATSFIEHMGGR